MRILLMSLFLNASLIAETQNPYDAPQVASCERISRSIRAYVTTQKLQNIQAVLKTRNIDFKDIQFPQVEGSPKVFLIDVNRLPEDLRTDFDQIKEDVRTLLPRSLG